MKWTEEQLKELKENCLYYFNNKRRAEIIFQRKWENIYSKAYVLKFIPRELFLIRTNKKCSIFLGCHVAERVLSHVFVDVHRMPSRNKGFDFICNKGYKVDVKASCLHNNNAYTFIMNYNKLTDYFLCIAFDNRENLNPQHIWLIKSDDICIMDKTKRMFKDICAINIKNTPEGLSKYLKYELTDKLKETISCCNTLKSKGDL